jgi:hypothetical protein
MTKVYIERGTKRVFACTYDWPGWCRTAKDEAVALEMLADYVERYRVVVDEAGLSLPKTAAKFEVVSRIKGDSTTDFGAPHKPAPGDTDALTAKQAERLAALVEASWRVFDKVVAGAPASLRKGPRGGGRDRDKMVDHVNAAENAYSRAIGIRKIKDPTEIRAAIIDVIHARPTDTRWPIRYAARRIAWHVLDHAWEIEDRSS